MYNVYKMQDIKHNTIFIFYFIRWCKEMFSPTTSYFQPLLFDGTV